ncbi:phage baseplate protein [Vibrio cholerae]|uniref:phage baseplate protein n=1 Tax=Vibrio cholerae TaxID=666 RepID=UPI002FE55760
MKTYPTYLIPCDVVSGANIGEVKFYPDATTVFNPQYTATQASLKLSDRSNISTHRTVQNKTVTLRIHVGKHPINFINNNMIGYSDQDGRPKIALEILKNWFSQGTPLNVYHELDVYSRFSIIDMSPVSQGDSLVVDLTLQEIRRANAKRDVWMLMAPELQKSAKPPTSRGITQKKEIPEDDVRSKWLKQTLGE